jgi:hypothetical protein
VSRLPLVLSYNKPELLRTLFNNLHDANLASGPISYEDLLPYDQVRRHLRRSQLCV